MNCAACQSPNNSVVHTLVVGETIKRRRQCERCRHRWTTFEITQDLVDQMKQIKQALAPIAQQIVK